MFKFITKMFCMALITALCMSTMFAQQRTVGAKEEALSSMFVTSVESVTGGMSLSMAPQGDGPSRAPGDVVFFENFNATTFPPTGWTRTQSSGTGNWARSTTNPYDVAHAWRAYTASGTQDTWLITPQIAVPSTGENWLVFMSYISDVSYAPTNGSAIYISTTGTSPANFSLFYTLAGTDRPESAWIKISKSLAAYAGQSIYIGFRYQGTNAHNWGIDNVTVMELPDNDLAITTVVYPYRQVPYSQTLIPTLTAKVTNNGLAVQTTVVVEVEHNGNLIASSTPIASLAPGASQDVTINIPASIAILSGANTMTLTVTQDQTEATPADNSATCSFTGSLSTFARDNDDPLASAYIGGTTFQYGNIYTFTKTTTINNVVSAFMYHSSYPMVANYPVKIYEVTGTNTVNNTPLYSGTGNRPTTTTGWNIHALTTPLELPAGSYFVCVGEIANIMIGTNAGVPNQICYSKTTTGTALSPLANTMMLRINVDLIDNDIASAPNHFPYSMVPQSLPSLPFPVTLSGKAINLGASAQTNITLSIAYNGNTYAPSNTIATLAPGATSADMTVSMTGAAFPTSLGTHNIEYTVTQAETDQNPSNNTAINSFEITNNIYAIDKGPGGGGIGYGNNGEVGNIFTITDEVVLESIIVGFSAAETTVPYSVAVYQMTGATTPSPTPSVIQGGFIRVPGAVVNHPVTPTTLAPGNYYVAVQENAADNAAVAHDGTQRPIYYRANGATTLSTGTSWGYVYIRMVFGEGTEPPDCDPPTNLAVDYTTDCSTAQLTWDAPAGKSITGIFGDYIGDATAVNTTLGIDETLPDVTVGLLNTGDVNDYIISVTELDLPEVANMSFEMDYVNIVDNGGGNYTLSRSGNVSFTIPSLTVPPLPPLLPSGGTFTNVPVAVTLTSGAIDGTTLSLDLSLTATVTVIVFGFPVPVPITVTVSFEGEFSGTPSVDISYNIYRSDSPTTPLATVTTNSYNDVTFDNTQGYTWSVKAVCDGGGESEAAEATKEACYVPGECAPPTNLVITYNAACDAILTWDEPIGGKGKSGVAPMIYEGDGSKTTEVKEKVGNTMQRRAPVQEYMPQLPKQLGLRGDGSTLIYSTPASPYYGETGETYKTTLGAIGGTHPQLSTINISYQAMEFVNGTIYVVTYNDDTDVNSFGSLDPVTGTFTTIKASGAPDAISMAWNPIDNSVYVVQWGTSTSCPFGKIDVTTGNYTSLGNVPGYIYITIDNTGTCYGVGANKFGTVNLANGSLTQISTYDAMNYIQQFNIDRETNELYHGYRNTGLTNTPLRKVNKADGTFTVVGTFALNVESFITMTYPGELCDPITNLTVTVNGTDVNLAWTAAAGADSYDILRNGGVIDNVTTTSYTDTGVPDGMHTYGVKALFTGDCIPQTVSAPPVQVGDMCYLKLDLHDSYGDGWNGGAAITVMVDGVSYGSYTIANGYEATYNVLIPSGELKLNWTAGSWDGECSFEVYDKEDILIYSASTGIGLSGTFFTYNYDCQKLAPRYNVYMDGSTTPIASNITTTTYIATGFDPTEGHTWCVTQVCGNDESDPICETMELCDDGSCNDVIIGTGTPTGYQIPINTFYDNSYSQQIFTAAEIGGEGMITAVAFQYIYGTPNVKNNQKYYLGYTTKNTFANVSDYVPLSNLTEVFSGTVTYNNANDWFIITFDTPFEYNHPECNLVLAILNNHGACPTGSSPTFRYTTTTGVNRTIHYYRDDIAIDPAAPAGNSALTANRSNTFFKVCEGVTLPTCDPPTNFAVAYDFECQAKLTWTPAGGCSLYNIYRDGDPVATNIFETSYTDTGFDELEGHTWEVKTVCDNDESTAATVTLDACDDGLCDKVPIGTGTTGTYQIPVNTYYNYSYSQQIFLANEIGEAGEITSLAFRYIYSNPTTKNPLTIYLGNTEQTVYAAANGASFIPLSQMQQVFTGSVTFSNGWVVIDFDTPFEYTGCNLVVAVLNNNNGYNTGSNNTFYMTSTPAGVYRTILYNKDSTPAGNINPDAMPTETVGYSCPLGRSNIIFKICDRAPYEVLSPVATAATDIACTSFVANWGAVTGATNYWLTVYAADNTPILTDQPTTNVNSYLVENLTPGTYYYYVKAVEVCVPSEPSNEIEVDTDIAYTITASVDGGHGEIDPVGTATVYCGENVTYTFTPEDDCYAIDQVLIDDTNDPTAVEDGYYTFEDISANHTIVVSFVIKEYDIVSTAGANGSIDPEGTTTVDCGDSQAYTFEPDEFCYTIDQVLINGTNNPTAVASGTYTFENVSDDQTIDVTFKIKTFTIIATAGPNGTLLPSGIITVECGDDLTFTFEADPDFEISAVLIDGVDYPEYIPLGTYTFENITDNHTITIMFQSTIVPPAYTIIASACDNATITPSGAITVNPGANQKFTFTAKKGYQIVEVLIDGAPDATALADGFYTFTDVQEDHTIFVDCEELEPGEYIIHTYYNQGGAISPNGDVYVPVGTDKTFLITPQQGYKIDQVWIDETLDTQAAIDGYYTFENVDAEHWITATFTYISIEQYYINASVSTVGGTITPSGKIMVQTGDEPEFTFTPQAGYQVKEVLVDNIDCKGALVGGVYKFAPIQSGHTIVGKFEKQSFIITSSIGTSGGTITPIGETSVTYGGSKAYTITAQTGYIIDKVLIDGVDNPAAVASGKYTFSNVDDNHTIVANFKYRTYDITATQTANGTVTPAGITAVTHGSNFTYYIYPDADYMIKTVLVDGKNNVGAVAAGFYTFTNVTAKHTISATFVPTTGAPADVETHELSLYPNPTDGQLTIDNGELTIENIEIFDVLGRCVATVETLRATSLQLDIFHLPSGIYFVRIKTETDVVIRKVVRE